MRERGGADARLRAFDGPERFDILNLSVVTDAAVEELGIDVRRLRPNILIGGDLPADAERAWPGRALAIGDALIGLYALRHRCIATTIDPDSGEQDTGVLRRIRERYANQVSLDCWVIRPGLIRLGDAVELTDSRALPDRIGGWIVGAPYRRRGRPVRRCRLASGRAEAPVGLVEGERLAAPPRLELRVGVAGEAHEPDQARHRPAVVRRDARRHVDLAERLEQVRRADARAEQDDVLRAGEGGARRRRCPVSPRDGARRRAAAGGLVVGDEVGGLEPVLACACRT